MRLINIKPGRLLGVALMLLPFVAIFVAYAVGSDIRLTANPADKLLPAPQKVWGTAIRLMTEADRRSGDILFWQDTWASLQRLALGIGISALVGLVFGLAIGLLPMARSLLEQFVAVISMIPPLALLPILFIVFGLGELSKVVLIVVGTLPFLIRDLSQRVLEVPQELIVKAQTLGASSWVIAMRVALPQLMPRLIQAVRLSLGPAWLFLIAAEAIAADAGLGYRIFLVRRYLAMDVILTYVIWITILAFIMDRLLRHLSRRAFPWAEDGM
ncbi:NitT/TauT family transport system permease protein [Jannaschia faecimaris]|uniref:NitT/TauT family transport system permease protein n=1 Tax=Jannaschia faecimaris TaxID=1244108 RepID=A0A1H3SPU6_9RHOB|nr:ABC transporter permease subunit [Jannaschia faecimaris]SDZ40103.1 NitT/TauT family transport system permease protein [Jannaschia faecimaris]